MLNASQKQAIKNVQNDFLKVFKEPASDVFQSCGRLEIIGNHVDYNGGSVINSNAGNLNIFTAASKCEDKVIIKSLGYPDLVVDLNDIEYKKEEEETSTALVKGILTRFKFLGYKVKGFKATMRSTIYKGGGVSSSASYAMSVSKILSYYYCNDSLSVVEMAKIGRWSENNFFGKGSGLQDQIGCSAKGFAITDYRDQENPILKTFNVDLGNYKIMLLDTKTDHSESQGGFQQLVTDMQEVSKQMNVNYLIEIPYDVFMNEYKKHSNERNWNRAYHFMTENQRVLRAYEYLSHNDIKSFLKEFNDSGLSSENYLKSIVAEGHTTNRLLEALHLGRASIKNGAIRVHGGGFGGTCMIFIDKDEEKEFKEKMSVEFPLEDFIDVEPSNDPLRRIPEEELK